MPIIQRKRPIVIDDEDDDGLPLATQDTFETTSQVTSSSVDTDYQDIEPKKDLEKPNESIFSRLRRRSGRALQTPPQKQPTRNSDIRKYLKRSNSPVKSTSSSSKPDIPLEIQLTVLDWIRLSDQHLPKFRSVCRAFRHAIDLRLYGILQKVTLIGSLYPHEKYVMNYYEERAAFLRATFVPPQDLEQDNQPWQSSIAVFRIGQEWFEDVEEMETDMKDSIYHEVRDNLDLDELPLAYGGLRWAIQVDDCVLDYDMDDPHAEEQTLAIDLLDDQSIPGIGPEIVVSNWQGMVWNFLGYQRDLHDLMEKKNGTSKFTFSNEEDCLRATRRQRLKNSLKRSGETIDIEAMKSLPPLWGKPDFRPGRRYFDDPDEYDETGLEEAERFGLKKLMQLREEARRKFESSLPLVEE